MQNKRFEIWVYILVILFSALFIYFGNKKMTSEKMYMAEGASTNSVVAIVESIVDIKTESIQSSGQYSFNTKDILFEAKIQNGQRKGEIVSGLQNINAYMMVVPKEIEVGDKVILFEISTASYGTDWVYGEYVRSDALMGLAIVFAVLLIIFGRSKGVKTLVSLLFTIMAIFYVFVPAVLAGKNIYLWAIIICVYTIVMTLILVSGLERKTLAASIGCFSGLAVSGFLVWFMDLFLGLTGIVNEESVYLIMMNPEQPLNLKAIVFAAILIGAMGAIMDVAMSIASSLNEIAMHSEKPRFSELVKSGMTIGRDIMGTMANTLILAYIGGSLTLVLLLITYTSGWIDLLNREMVVIEVLQSLVGSMGILFTLPLTTFVSAFLYTHHKTK